MKLRYILSIAALLSGVAVFGQEYNPSVEVTNDYSVSLGGEKKPDLTLSLPDSISRFHLDFDYEVFEKQYRGAYSFSPYNVMFIPESSFSKAPVFYLKAGAGYHLRPELTAVVTPRLGKRFSLSLYEDFNAYFGPYDNASGYDASESAGVMGRVRMDEFDLSFDLAYNGIYTSMTPEVDWLRPLAKSAYNNFGGSLRMTSAEWADKFMSYDVKASYNLGRDNSAPQSLTESRFLIEGTLAPTVKKGRYRIAMDFATGYTGYYGLYDNALYYCDAAPKLVFNLWKFNFSTGLMFSYKSNGGVNSLHLYPALKVNLGLFDKKLDIFAGVKGGESLNTYSRFKSTDHFFTPGFLPEIVPGFSRERVNIYAGFGGCVGTVFHYDIAGGHKSMDDMPVYSFPSNTLHAIYAFSAYNETYVDFKAALNTRSVDVNAGVHYRHTDLSIRGEYLIDIPSLEADLSILYNWRQRLFAGVDAEYCSGFMNIPYVNLGLYFESRLSRSVSLWARGNNLLGQNITRVPGVSEKGVCITGGVCLKFR